MWKCYCITNVVKPSAICRGCPQGRHQARQGVLRYRGEVASYGSVEPSITDCIQEKNTGVFL
ncbi:hypothetical protein C1H46_018679 [Malus baccata]|uniref:Uncharacterized protein n=1 Tax=Malus baccata TaxID=106549 RepID=A0A540MAG0_MALBA|nr:hypothetical protein C1H46_018679 [Malus baccata]